jgi:hypothetical protein
MDLEAISNLISQNNFLISVIIISITSLFAFIKWLDTRNREIKEKRYSKYRSLISTIFGKREDSSTPNLGEQIACVWLLEEYKEYYNTTSKILSNSDMKNMGDKLWVAHVFPHFKKLLEEIKN